MLSGSGANVQNAPKNKEISSDQQNDLDDDIPF